MEPAFEGVGHTCLVRSPVPIRPSWLTLASNKASLTTLELWLSLLFPPTDQHPAGSWAHRPKGEGIYFLSLTTYDWTSAGGLPSKYQSNMFVLMA